MSQTVWSAVEQYLCESLVRPAPALNQALEACTAAGLPPIAVAPAEGKLLSLLARAVGARRILEVGTLGGYSTLWLAQALPPGGRIVTLELEPRHAEVARANFERAGCARSIEVRVGRALDLLPVLAREGDAPFDFVFVDADKPSNPEYFEWALELSRPGALIVVDNVVREGAVRDAASEDPAVIGVRRLNERIAREPRVSATALQTVGSKGYDGLAVILVTAGPTHASGAAGGSA